METRKIFDNLSPLDHRYYQSNRDLFTKLSYYLSETASVRYCAKVEMALLRSHLKLQGLDSPSNLDFLGDVENRIDPELVYEEEEKTQHNIRALVNTIKPLLPQELRPFVHMGATSVDILDTANALKIRDGVEKVLLPLLIDLENELVRIVTTEAATPQVGRTHGQYAVPITLGFAFAEYLSRLGKSILEIRDRARNLRGKLAGAVGAYNATSMITSDPEALERETLSYLDLLPSDHSTQMVEPEYLLRLLTEVNIAFGVIANLADDLRNLQRSEIDEVREFFSETQVGSSTMPQKRNPWNSEHVKSLWKAFSPRIMSFFMDQISEHQRDLTNSASGRFVPEYISGFAAAVTRMTKILKGLRVNHNQLKDTLENRAGSSVLAEAAYILLGQNGESDAHEIIRKITLETEAGDLTFAQALRKDTGVWKIIQERLSKVSRISAEEFFHSPANYSGKAEKKALSLAEHWNLQMLKLAKELGE
ncbi:MAG: adenylosuccinate lyase [Spirochaetales bacterium]|nr:adenylosuccinate lyase [Spirochaetales bacterium]